MITTRSSGYRGMTDDEDFFIGVANARGPISCVD